MTAGDRTPAEVGRLHALQRLTEAADHLAARPIPPDLAPDDRAYLAAFRDHRPRRRRTPPQQPRIRAMTLPVAAALAWPYHRPAPPPRTPAPWWAELPAGLARYCPISGKWLPRPGAFSFWLGREG